MAQSVTDYLEIQQNEIDALRSIFMEDFVEEERRAGAWNKTADRAFRLKLKHPSDKSGNMFVTLKVSLPTTYPKTLPRCQLVYGEEIRQKVKGSIETLIKFKPNTLLGSEMIYELATCIQEILEDSMQADTQDIPALDEERKKQEAASQRKAEEAQEKQRRRQKEASMEEERLLAQMVEQEEARLMKLKTQSAHESEPFESLEPQNISDGLRFDQQVSTKDTKGTVLVFRTVYGKVEYRHGPVTDLYTVQPLGSSKNSTPYLVLKQCVFTGSKHIDRLKKSVQGLESALESLIKLTPHPSILRPLAFNVQRLAASPSPDIGGWSINILSNLLPFGSLQDLLETVGTLQLSNVRSWTIQIIEGLDFLHRNNFVHGTIHPQNVLLERTETRTTIVKLCDGLSQHRLHLMKREMEHNHLAPITPYWTAPELTKNAHLMPSNPTDIWDLGLVFIQMLFGLEAKVQHTSPSALMEAFDLSQSLADMLSQIFKVDPKKRPTAFDLLPHEFLRNDDPVLSQQSSPFMSRVTSSGSLAGSKQIRMRHDSTNVASTPSRYVNDFVEAGRLGKGGFGEVVKARNKLDGRFYAIKKVVQSSASALSGVLSEIILLSRLNHPNVVRYYTAWIEEEGRHEDGANASVANENSSDSFGSSSSIVFGHNTSGLDFISSSGYPKIEFGYESGDDGQHSDAMNNEDTLSDEEDDNSYGGHAEAVPQPSKRRSSVHSSSKTILYIQMEYCERQTLRDLIRNGLHSNVEEGWRLFRQVLEGLSHVHGNGIIHRDLKPDNIFIDNTNNVRIGDFGLAKNTYQTTTKPTSTEITNPSLTRSIGTSLYVAPEVRSTNSGDYNEKADMYSLGIILFEMSFPLKTAMERAQILGQLHERNHTLPAIFEEPEKSVQGDIINALVKHKPGERPSSIELLRSGKVPLQFEDETIRMALDGIADSTSPYYSKLMSGLFSQKRDEDGIRNYTYDTSLKANSDYEDLLRGIVKQKLTAIFRRHGALEKSRPLLLPNSSYYTNTAVRLLNASGMLVQLPYDLTLPHARMLAKQVLPGRKTFAFGDVYREVPTGGHPRSHGEVDFDIVSLDNLDLALREAEVIKVIDEIIDAFPSLASVQLCYHINHSRLLDSILDFCSVIDSKRAVVKEVISKLNIGQWTWAKIRNELRAPSIAIPSTSLDELMRFDFRDTYTKAIPKLRQLLPNSEELESIFSHLQVVTTYLDRFSVKRKIYINPLSSFNNKFYRGNFLFQCIVDKRHRDVFAAGGRYDRLILEHRSNPKVEIRHAVGFNLGWERLFTSMARYQKTTKSSKNLEEDAGNQWLPRRCDVLINSFDAAILRSTGIKILQELWANDISSELVIDTVATEDSGQQQTQDTEPHGYVVLIKQDESLKVRNVLRKEDVELRSSELVGWLRSEMRDRDRAEGRTYDRARLLRQSSQQDPVAVSGDHEADVKVLISHTKSKKTNRRNIIEDAQSRAQELVRSFLDGPIAAIETKDEIFEGLRDTHLSDPDSWRKLIQSTPLADRNYLGDLHKLLSDMASEATGNTRNAFIYNFRTRACIFYNLKPSTAKFP